MSRNVGKWIVPVNRRDGGRYSYRGGKARFDRLKTAFKRFEEENLENLVLESPLGAMYKAMQNFTYWSAVVYNILVRSVTSDANDHLLFRFGDTICRLGRPEFALISGLSFLPTEVDHRSIEEIGPSSLIEHHDPATGVRSYGPFGMNVENIKIEDIEARLVDEEKAEIVYKLGLVYLIDAVMYGRASKHYVSRFVFNLVDANSMDPPPPPPSSGDDGNAQQTHNSGKDEHQHHQHQEEQTDTYVFRNEQGHAEQLHDARTNIDLLLTGFQNSQYYVPKDATLGDDFYRCFNDSWGTTTAATLKEATSSAAVGDVRDVRHDERPDHEDHNGDTSTVNEATSWADVGDVGQGKRHVREEHNCDVPLPKRKTTQKTNLNSQTNMIRREVRKR